MLRCINIDWLCYFGYINCDLNYIPKMLEHNDMYCNLNSKSTPYFKRWYTIFFQSEAVAQLCCEPHSLKKDGGIFNEGAATMQLTNRMLYTQTPIALMERICRACNFQFKSLNRIDICYDFQYFDNKLKPENLIRGFYAGQYRKIHSGKTWGIGKQHHAYDPESWYQKGEKSAVGVKLYNKTKELKEKHNKPYILDAWEPFEFVPNKYVWRLEVSIHASGKAFKNECTGELAILDVSKLDNKQEVYDIFMRYISHYFEWRYFEQNKKISNMKPIKLFNFDENAMFWSPAKMTESKKSGKTDKQVLKYLQKFVEENPNHENLYEVKTTMFALMEKMRRDFDINIKELDL